MIFIATEPLVMLVHVPNMSTLRIMAVSVDPDISSPVFHLYGARTSAEASMFEYAYRELQRNTCAPGALILRRSTYTALAMAAQFAGAIVSLHPYAQKVRVTTMQDVDTFDYCAVTLTSTTDETNPDVADLRQRLSDLGVPLEGLT